MRLLQSLEAEQVAAVEKTRQFPAFNPGDVLELKVVSSTIKPGIVSAARCHANRWAQSKMCCSPECSSCGYQPGFPGGQHVFDLNCQNSF